MGNVIGNNVLSFSRKEKTVRMLTLLSLVSGRLIKQGFLRESERKRESERERDERAREIGRKRDR